MDAVEVRRRPAAPRDRAHRDRVPAVDSLTGPRVRSGKALTRPGDWRAVAVGTRDASPVRPRRPAPWCGLLRIWGGRLIHFAHLDGFGHVGPHAASGDPRHDGVRRAGAACHYPENRAARALAAGGKGVVTGGGIGLRASGGGRSAKRFSRAVFVRACYGAPRSHCWRLSPASRPEGPTSPPEGGHVPQRGSRAVRADAPGRHSGPRRIAAGA